VRSPQNIVECVNCIVLQYRHEGTFTQNPEFAENYKIGAAGAFDIMCVPIFSEIEVSILGLIILEGRILQKL
jgi:hypothetical protein